MNYLIHRLTPYGRHCLPKRLSESSSITRWEDKRHVPFIIAVLHHASYKEEADPNNSGKGLNHVKTGVFSKYGDHSDEH